jgi:hypothetical protein
MGTEYGDGPGRGVDLERDRGDDPITWAEILAELDARPLWILRLPFGDDPGGRELFDPGEPE